jgi:subtilisin family serine protease
MRRNFSWTTVRSILLPRLTDRSSRLVSLMMLIFVVAAVSRPMSVAAQQFYDCPSVPGEYIVKYKAPVSNLSKTPAGALLAQREFVHSKLGAAKITGYTEVSDRIESFKTEKGRDTVVAMLKDPDFAAKVEYIQANCIYKQFDYRVSGTLRDPAAKRPQYPLSVQAAAVDRSDWNTFGLAASVPSELQAWDVGIPNAGSNGEVRRAPFVGTSSFQAHFDTEQRGLAGITSFGTAYFTDEKGDYTPISMLVSQKNRGNGTYKLDQVLALDELGESTLVVARKGHLNDDFNEDFAALLQNGDGSSKIVLLTSDDLGYRTSELPIPDQVTEMVLADVNGDAQADIVVLNITQDGALEKASVSFITGNDQDGFRRVGQVALPSEGYTQGFRIVEINNDSYPDIIAISSTSVAIARGTGNLTFEKFQETSLEKLYGADSQIVLREIDSADLDGNGAADAVITCDYKSSPTSNPQSVVTLLFGKDGVFATVLGYIIGNVPADGYADLVTLQDVTGDSRVDVVYSQGDAEQFTVFVNQSSTDVNKPIVLKTLKDFSFPLGVSPYRASVIDPFAIANAPVLMQSSAGTSFVTFTDDYGNFAFSSIPAGEYTPQVLVDGYFFPTFSGIPLHVDKHTTGLLHFGKRKPFTPPDSPVTKAPNTPNDYGFNLLWGLHNYGQMGGVDNVDVDAPNAWSTTRGGGVVVAVFDSGVDVYHPELLANRWVNPKEIPDNDIDDDKNGAVDDAYGFQAITGRGDPIDDDFHGTHVAGTIAAGGNNSDGVVGVAPEAKVLGIRIADTEGNLTAKGIINAANYVLWAKKQGHNIHVVNASFGSNDECQPFDIDYLQALHRAGVLFVAAAGNNGGNNDTAPISPANCDVPNVVSVAAVNKTGALASFSNYGAGKVHVAAPGEEIWSLTPDRGYESLQGTSMAAPHVAGVAALLFSARPQLTPEQAKLRLIQTSKPLTDLAGKVVAGGIVSAVGALAGDSSQGSGSSGGSGGSAGGSGAASGGSVGGATPAISYRVSQVVAKKTTPVAVQFSENLASKSASCFSGALSPKKKNQSVRATLKGSKLSLQLTEKKGKKIKVVPWPAKGKLVIRIVGNCVTGLSGGQLDTDFNGQAGGPSVFIERAIGAKKS